VVYFFILTTLLAGFQIALGDCAMTLSPVSQIPVELRVDFGPVGRPLVVRNVKVPGLATPRKALEQLFPVEGGKVCSSPEEVRAIDGVSADPGSRCWWMVEVNGSWDVNAHRTRLKKGDTVRWIYGEDKK